MIKANYNIKAIIVNAGGSQREIKVEALINSAFAAVNIVVETPCT